MTVRGRHAGKPSGQPPTFIIDISDSFPKGRVSLQPQQCVPELSVDGANSFVDRIEHRLADRRVRAGNDEVPQRHKGVVVRPGSYLPVDLGECFASQRTERRVLRPKALRMDGDKSEVREQQHHDQRDRDVLADPSQRGEDVGASRLKTTLRRRRVSRSLRHGFPRQEPRTLLVEQNREPVPRREQSSTRGTGYSDGEASVSRLVSPRNDSEAQQNESIVEDGKERPALYPTELPKFPIPKAFEALPPKVRDKISRRRRW